MDEGAHESHDYARLHEYVNRRIPLSAAADLFRADPVMSSCNIPTIPLTVAQAMNPAPRPPSPTARDATQKALRRENPDQLSSRDAQILLMGMPTKENGTGGERARLESFFTNDTVSTNGSEPPAAKKVSSPKSPAPPRPSREMRRASVSQTPSDYVGLSHST